ncbi:MAG TPA: hypothetical protein VFU81_00670 [Thermomicrobiales bacterium]|nr:hypothetical protein [Thermomicrobiales bacterium]
MTAANRRRPVCVLRALVLPAAGGLTAFSEAADENFAPIAGGAGSSIETDDMA